MEVKVKGKPKSFEEFYFSKDNEIHDIEKIIIYVDSHNNSTGYYNGSMFCPECRSAELHFVHKTSKRRAFLRRSSSTKHDDLCSYNFEYTSKKIATEFVEDLDKSQMQDRLASALNMLFKKKKAEKHKNTTQKKFGYLKRIQYL